MTEPSQNRTAGDMSPDDVTVTDDKIVYDGYFRMRRLQLRHGLFAGGASDEITREVFERGHAVAVLPYDPVTDQVIVIEQFRIGAWAAGFHPWLLEIVAGIIEPGESPEDVVRREVREEAGVAAKRLAPISHYLCSPGCSSESVRVFCAEVDASGAGGIHGLDQEHEDIRVRTADMQEIETLLRERRIDNGSTLVALQWLMLNRDELRRHWLE